MNQNKSKISLESDTLAKKENTGQSGNVNSRVSQWFHSFAGVILLIYAASHFGFLFIPDEHHNLHNIVFPLVTNWVLYLIVGCIEMAVGIVCLKIRGHFLVNVALLTFVAAMLWYKWAFYYLGGSYCGCTGLLGRLFHLKKQAENIVPLVTLGLLTFSTTPWLYRGFREFVNLKVRATVFFILLVCHQAFGSEIIQMKGTIDWQDYVPATGKPVAKYQGHHKFVATIQWPAWKICITNVERPQWWAELVCDGTNTYFIQPKTKYGFLAKGADKNPSTDTQTVVIDKSPGFPREFDEMEASIGWFTFGLSPRSIYTNNIGLIDMPVPTSSARDNLKSYGYKWLITWSDDGKYAKEADAVRDKALDLSDKEEMLRPNLDYPETLAKYNAYLQTLRVREATPNGFIKFHYTAEEWYHTNNILIPTASKVEVYWWDMSKKTYQFPWHVIKLKATDITFNSEESNLLPEISMPTEVRDYRYKKANETRIFKYAEYTLNNGDFWKSDNDPAILNQVSDYLKHGRKYTTFSNQKKEWVAWTLLITAISPLVILALISLKNKTKKPTK